MTSNGSNSDENEFHVTFVSTGRRVTLAELRAQATRHTGKVPHLWVIQAVYSVADPEQDLSLDEDNFVGVTQISCMMCRIGYRVERLGETCPIQPPMDRR